MSEIENPSSGAAEQQGVPAQFQLQKIYVKDVSFELPNAPEVFRDEGQVEIKLNLSQRMNNLEDDVFEVILTVTVTASIEEKTVYLAEVAQAGLFVIRGLSESQQQGVLNTLCPHTLFPYASRTISGLVSDGGFPPLVLQPINFEQVYQQRLQEAQARAEQAAGDLEVQGNA